MTAEAAGTVDTVITSATRLCVARLLRIVAPSQLAETFRDLVIPVSLNGMVSES